MGGPIISRFQWPVFLGKMCAKPCAVVEHMIVFACSCDVFCSFKMLPPSVACVQTCSILSTYTCSYLCVAVCLCVAHSRLSSYQVVFVGSVHMQQMRFRSHVNSSIADRLHVEHVVFLTVFARMLHVQHNFIRITEAICIGCRNLTSS